MTVGVYSPLPRVFDHFVRRLREQLTCGGADTELLDAPDGEVAGSHTARASALIRHVKAVRSNSRREDPIVVTWPLLGWWDLLLWRRKSPTIVLFHDPEPLRRQFGISKRSARAASALTETALPTIGVHSTEAATICHNYLPTANVVKLPHPMSEPPRSVRHVDRSTVLVLGQFKPVRDLDVMRRLAPPLRKAGLIPLVAGRGWPKLDGWDRRDGFLSEDDFEKLAARALAVIIPYRTYFQSGVALRALEVGTPVVGRETSFLRDVLGTNFPGHVPTWESPNEWLNAIWDAAANSHRQAQAATQYARRGVQLWSHAVNATS